METFAYQDLILIGIAGSILGGILISLLTTIGLQTGVFLGSAVATIFMYDALFRNPPLPRKDPRMQASAILWHAFLLVVLLAVFL